jgi:hypothetical protein
MENLLLDEQFFYSPFGVEVFGGDFHYSFVEPMTIILVDKSIVEDTSGFMNP